MRALRRACASDTGAGMVIVMLVTTVLSALTLTLAVVTTGNLGSARASQQSTAAAAAADAGVSQAITYLRSSGVSVLNKCSPTCTTTAWGNKANPMHVPVPGKASQSYKVWIEPVARFPQVKPGVYRIHATGYAGATAARTVTTDVRMDNFQIPLGIMAKSINGGGDAGVHHESIFTTGCVYGRSKIQFEGIDIAYGEPAAVHSSQVITDDQGSGQFCPSTKKPIHDPKTPTPQRYCNPAYPNDQDKFGGPLAGTSCVGPGGTYPQTSLISSDADLFKKYKFQAPALTQGQIDALKTIAISQNNYWTQSTGWTSPTQDNAVMFFDLANTDPGGRVDLNDVIGYSRTPGLSADAAGCQPRSLAIVIEGGNARLNSNQNLFGSVFLTSGDPYGHVLKANGNAIFTGTLYANSIDLTGTVDMHLDECFLNNISPALMGFEAEVYRELDR